MSGDEFDKISAKLVGRSVQPWPPNQSTHTGYEKRFLSSWPSLEVLCWIWDWDFCTAATQTTSLRDNKDQYIYKKNAFTVIIDIFNSIFVISVYPTQMTPEPLSRIKKRCCSYKTNAISRVLWSLTKTFSCEV